MLNAILGTRMRPLYLANDAYSKSFSLATLRDLSVKRNNSDRWRNWKNFPSFFLDAAGEVLAIRQNVVYIDAIQTRGVLGRLVVPENSPACLTKAGSSIFHAN